MISGLAGTAALPGGYSGSNLKSHLLPHVAQNWEPILPGRRKHHDKVCRVNAIEGDAV